MVAVLTATPARQRAAHDSPYTHECHHGFCVVCGSVWPCSRAQRMTPRHSTPIPRIDDLGY
jgi:hypothetical protein